MILTGTSDIIDAEEALRAGASAFLRKEEGIDELRKVFFEVASLTAALGDGIPAPRRTLLGQIGHGLGLGLLA